MCTCTLAGICNRSCTCTGTCALVWELHSTYTHPNTHVLYHTQTDACVCTCTCTCTYVTRSAQTNDFAPGMYIAIYTCSTKDDVIGEWSTLGEINCRELGFIVVAKACLTYTLYFGKSIMCTPFTCICNNNWLICL